MSNLSAARHMIEKIKEAAKDGQDGSAAYALDRLRLIEQIADMAARKLDTVAEPAIQVG